ncbi:MAG: methylmalonyl-CoA mutase family protein, partial [Bacteroidota bacterium]
INVMRRVMQSSGAEIIHLGHDRSVQEIVDCAIQEDANAIAITSYQGGHNEYFKYMFDLLKERGCGHIKIFGGGGGTILPEEIADLHNYGIVRIYHPDDGRTMGLQGMINDVLKQSDYATGTNIDGEEKRLKEKDYKSIAKLISAAENFNEENKAVLDKIREAAKVSKTPVIGITGTGGAGKSSLVDELVRRFLLDFEDKKIGIISVDPSKRKTGGALLGDRIRMNSIKNERVYMRSLATRQSNLALSKYVKDAVDILKASEFDLVILETAGIGQSDTEIIEHSNMSLYVMTPEFGAATQLEKIDMLEFADIVAINKFDKRGALDAIRDVKKQYKRNHNLWEIKDEEIPVYGTIASQFNDPGTNTLYKAVMDKLVEKTKCDLKSNFKITDEMSEKIYIIPPNRTRYLSEISEASRQYDKWANDQSVIALKLQGIRLTIDSLKTSKMDDRDRIIKALEEQSEQIRLDLDPKNLKTLETFDDKKKQYQNEYYIFKVRDKEIKIKTHYESLSHSQIPKVAVPKYSGWADILKWSLRENFPGEFPYTSGIYPFKREGEDPTRMFAGEGGPERTNKRFHYVSLGMPAHRLSTAFDSVTLYGNDPDHRPDIFGKIGNSGVSVCCLDDAKKLYSGFNLADPKTSVSMTINGPAATIAAFFMNAAIDQQCELYIKANGLEKQVEEKIAAIYKTKGTKRPSYQASELPEGNNGLGLMLLGITGDMVLPKDVYEKIKTSTLSQVRGTVQADILKEDQAQNTCIFSTEFSLRVMGDVQQYFIDENVRNFYSVSISGYHIAEAGA